MLYEEERPQLYLHEPGQKLVFLTEVSHKNSPLCCIVLALRLLQLRNMTFLIVFNPTLTSQVAFLCQRNPEIIVLPLETVSQKM